MKRERDSAGCHPSSSLAACGVCSLSAVAHANILAPLPHATLTGPGQNERTDKNSPDKTKTRNNNLTARCDWLTSPQLILPMRVLNEWLDREMGEPNTGAK
jgi:hypothetical protein